MPTFTVQKLVDRAASEADMIDNFVSPTEWLDWFNAERSDLLLLAARSGWVLQGVTQVSVPGTGLYTHPTEFLGVIGIWEVDTAGRARPLEVDNFVDAFWQADGGPVTGPATRVSVVDVGDGTTEFRFYPRPTSGTYIIALVPAPVPATAMTDTFNFPMGTEERVVLGMARHARRKEESDIADITRAIREQEAKVEEVAWVRTMSQVPHVRNVDRMARGWFDRIIFPAPDMWLWV